MMEIAPRTVNIMSMIIATCTSDYCLFVADTRRTRNQIVMYMII